MRLTLFTLFAVLLLMISCKNTHDAETIRLYVRASDVYSLGRFAEAAEILRSQNNFPPALILRAKAEYFSGDIDNAEKSCRRAIKLRPSSLEAKLYMARILREKGNLAGAVKTLEDLLADNPQDIRALRLAAELEMEMGNFGEAALLLDRAADLSFESAMVLLDRARLRWIAGRGSDALEDLSRARAMLPWDTALIHSISNLENIIREVM
jgi:tetratricopeptide (TPR) repeat protein